MPNNQIMSMEGQLCGIPLAGPESFSQQQLDYLKRALGVDETVLYNANGSPSQTGPWTLSEAYTNFEFIKVKYQNESSDPPNARVSLLSTTSTDHKIVLPVTEEDPQYKLRMFTLRFYGSSASIKSNSIARYMWSTNGSCSVSTNAAQAPYITQIIGVHRIAGGN